MHPVFKFKFNIPERNAVIAYQYNDKLNKAKYKYKWRSWTRFSNLAHSIHAYNLFKVFIYSLPFVIGYKLIYQNQVRPPDSALSLKDKCTDNCPFLELSSANIISHWGKEQREELLHQNVTKIKVNRKQHRKAKPSRIFVDGTGLLRGYELYRVAPGITGKPSPSLRATRITRGSAIRKTH